MTTNTSAPNWVPVARELFEYEMIPWIGREYAAWLRTSARPHPSDRHRSVLVPERIYQVFAQRQPGERVTRAQLESMQYPRLPEEDELPAAHLEQRLASVAGDSARLRSVHQKIDRLEVQLDDARRSLETWRRADPKKLEEQIAFELANAPHADVLVGIHSAADRA
jgi:hypothetical protein